MRLNTSLHPCPRHLARLDYSRKTSNLTTAQDFVHRRRHQHLETCFHLLKDEVNIGGVGSKCHPDLARTNKHTYDSPRRDRFPERLQQSLSGGVLAETTLEFYLNL